MTTSTIRTTSSAPRTVAADGAGRPGRPGDGRPRRPTCAARAFAGLHPVVQAAYLLHALDHVQPFADGNGRVGRALAGGCLLRAAGIPYLVLDGPPTSPLVDVLLVDLHVGGGGPALDRWRAQEAAGDGAPAAG